MKKQLLIVDGYNMIGAWPELARLKNQNKLEDAREALLHRLSNYAKYEGIEVMVVFDAQLVPGIQQSYKKYQLTVVFTKEEETADSYIERVTGEKNDLLTQVSVATSDLAEQWLIFSKGALRISARELYDQVRKTERTIAIHATDIQYQSFRRNSPWDLEQLSKLSDILEELSNEKD